MTKWLIMAYRVDLRVGLASYDVARVWTRKNKKTQLSAWEELGASSREGWELVGVVPIDQGGTTVELLFTLKKPIEE